MAKTVIERATGAWRIMPDEYEPLPTEIVKDFTPATQVAPEPEPVPQPEPEPEQEFEPLPGEDDTIDED